jgi:hypothetical protein
MCDFSTDLDETRGPWFGYDLSVAVGLVRARYGADGETELPFVNGGKAARPYRNTGIDRRELDEQALARMVGQALAC